MENAEPLWIHEKTTPDEMISWRVHSVLARGTSPYQSYLIGRSNVLGHALFIDDVIQAAESDEFIYHESLVHPLAVLAGEIRNICIIGGGEGATLREVLRYRSISKALMVDIDSEVVEACRTFLPQFHQGAFEDPRTELIFADAWDILEQHGGEFDALIMDITDPVPDSPAERLYGETFLRLIAKSLTPHGIFSSLAGSVEPRNNKAFIEMISTARKVFNDVRPYVVSVPSFSMPWGFLLAGKERLPDLGPEEIDRRLPAEVARQLRHYDGKTHQMLFTLPKYLRKALSI